ncbi:MAG: 30S ribosomal protein S21 [Candidatus Komeilibacteria bacterium]|nr:30S ribosomal protein S21 [Candidatus Komeilibacteria bacterium]
MVEVKRKEGESFESLIRRFSRRTVQSGRLIQAKKIRFFQKPASSLAKKESALRRAKNRNQREYLKRIGKLDETQERRRRPY